MNWIKRGRRGEEIGEVINDKCTHACTHCTNFPHTHIKNTKQNVPLLVFSHVWAILDTGVFYHAGLLPLFSPY